MASISSIPASRPRPWFRFWARIADWVLAILLFHLIANLAGTPIPPMYNWMAGWIAVMCWIPIDAILISTLGTTPGKWLFHIHLSEKDGERVPFLRSLSRAAEVMIDGEALGIPGVFLFTQIAAYNRLTAQGRTSWDARNRIEVRHEELGMYRILGILLIVMIVIFIRMGRGGR